VCSVGGENNQILDSSHFIQLVFVPFGDVVFDKFIRHLPFSSALHLICSGIVGLGGIYHAIFGPERLEETTYANPFSYQWQDRFRITAILGAHNGTLGSAALLLTLKGVYLGGLYDTWALKGLSLFSRCNFRSNKWLLISNTVPEAVLIHFSKVNSHKSFSLRYRLIKY
jgi:hypothetical protein